MPLLEKLNGYQYHWKDETYDASLQTGFLAQKVEKELPDFVKKITNKILSKINYKSYLPV